MQGDDGGQRKTLSAGYSRQCPAGHDDDERQQVLRDDGIRRAEARAMKLLSWHMMTVHEMQERLTGDGFAPEQVRAAVSYCSSFGYLNDSRYAENYLFSMRDKKSAGRIRCELEEKGVDEEVIDRAFEENPCDEDEVIYSLICRKAGEPHVFDDKELRRVYAFLARKGFNASDIWKAVHRFQDAAPDEETGFE